MLRLLLLSTTLIVALFHPAISAQDADTADAEQTSGDEAAAEEAPPEKLVDMDAVLEDPAGMVEGWINDAMLWIEEDGGAALMNFLVFLVILIVFRILAGVAASLVGKALSNSKLKVSDLLKHFAENTTRKVIFLIGLIIALDSLGVPVAPLVAGLGVVGFVVGFALQDTLGNFAAGIMILLYRPFDVGDYVEAGGTAGGVVAMTLVSTTFKTPDNKQVIVPNGSIWGGTITNYSANDTRRVDMTMGIGYGDDIDKAREVIERVVTAHELVLKEPAVQIEVANLGDSSVDFVVRPWCKNGDYWAVKFDLTKQLKQAFDKEGISIPFPQRDVHLFNET